MERKEVNLIIVLVWSKLADSYNYYNSLLIYPTLILKMQFINWLDCSLENFSGSRGRGSIKNRTLKGLLKS